MYAVIFTADLNVLDDEYYETANKMRDLAINEYGCINIISVTENNQEVTISYWPNTKKIAAWKNNEAHIRAQLKGKEHWYKSYKVEIVKVQHQYSYSL